MTGKNWLRYTGQTVLEIWMGIGLFWLIGELIILFLPIKTLPAASAYLLGAIMSGCSITHIAYVTELTLDMHDQSAAEKHTISRYMMRMVITAAVIVAAYYTSYLNVPALVIGLFGSKAGAYLQPSMHRFLEWIHEKASIKKEGGE